MPYGDPDPEDPSVLVGVALPAGRDAIRQMAYTFAEEFAAMGFDERRLMALFRNPFYAGAHQAWVVLGQSEVEGIVRECVGVWGRFRVVVKDAAGV